MLPGLPPLTTKMENRPARGSSGADMGRTSTSSTAPTSTRKLATAELKASQEAREKAGGVRGGNKGAETTVKNAKSKFPSDVKHGPVESALLSFGPVSGKHEGTVLVLGASAASESCLQDPVVSARSRAIVQYPTWIATTTSRPRRPVACSAQGFTACGVMRQFSPTHLVPQPQARWAAVAHRLRHARGWRPRSKLREL